MKSDTSQCDRRHEWEIAEWSCHRKEILRDWAQTSGGDFCPSGLCLLGMEELRSWGKKTLGPWLHCSPRLSQTQLKRTSLSNADSSSPKKAILKSVQTSFPQIPRWQESSWTYFRTVLASQSSCSPGQKQNKSSSESAGNVQHANSESFHGSIHIQTNKLQHNTSEV